MGVTLQEGKFWRGAPVGLVLYLVLLNCALRDGEDGGLHILCVVQPF